MKKIILDDLKRQWYIWGGLCLSYMVCGLMAIFAEDYHIWSILILPAWLTLFLTRFERQPGNLRVILSLPFTARQIGRMFWWLRAGIPIVFLAFFGGLGIAFANKPAEFFATWIRFVLISGLIFGSIFWLFSGAPSQPWNGWKNRIQGHIYSSAFSIGLIGGCYFLYKSTIGDEMKFIIICCFGFVFSVLGWFRAEGLVIDYGQYRQEAADSGKPTGKFKPRPGYGGVPFLLMTICLRCLGIAAFIMALLTGYSVWHDHQSNLSKILSAPMFSVQWLYFFYCFMYIVSIGPHLKFLRTLPMTSKQLAAVILALAFAPPLLVGIISASLAWAGYISYDAWSLVKDYALAFAPVSVLTTAAVWHKENRPERIFLTAFVLIISMIPLVIQLMMNAWNSDNQGLPLWIIIGVPLISTPLALLTISRLLERNDMTYRIRQEMIDNWQ